MPFVNKKAGQAYRHRYYLAHRKLVKERARQWVKANPDRRKAITLRYRDSHTEQCRESVRKSTRKHAARAKTRKERYFRKHPERAKTYNQTDYAIRKGVLKRPKACCWCGETKRRIEAHHPDYSKPLKVVWLCARCHRYLHGSRSK